MQSTSSLDCPYKVGQVLTLQQRPGDNAPSLTLRIKKMQSPWTLSCGMIVEILHKPTAKSKLKEWFEKSKETAPTAFLKLYDWRFAYQNRDDHKVGEWTQEAQRQHIELASTCDFGELLRRLRDDEEFGKYDYWDSEDDSDDEDEWGDGYDEAHLADESLMMYQAETAAYERLSNIQGTMIPRVLATGMLPPTIEGVEDRYKEHFYVRGILLQYLDGFTLAELPAHIPSNSWQDIVDQAIRIVHALGDNDVLNRDVRRNNFIVPMRDQKYQVFMIDFGLSRLRGKDESDFEWGHAKWDRDEEGAVGRVMQNLLGRHGINISYQPSRRYHDYELPPDYD